MVDRNTVCLACDGTGMLADDEEWQYTCTVCGGDGQYHPNNSSRVKYINVDENNRLLD